MRHAFFINLDVMFGSIIFKLIGFLGFIGFIGLVGFWGRLFS